MFPHCPQWDASGGQTSLVFVVTTGVALHRTNVHVQALGCSALCNLWLVMTGSKILQSDSLHVLPDQTRLSMYSMGLLLQRMFLDFGGCVQPKMHVRQFGPQNVWIVFWGLLIVAPVCFLSTFEYRPFVRVYTYSGVYKYHFEKHEQSCPAARIDGGVFS